MSYIICFLEIESLHMKYLHCPFIYYQCLPTFASENIDWYHSPLPWKFEHRVHLNTVSYLSKCCRHDRVLPTGDAQINLLKFAMLEYRTLDD
jgi:hypothetical protein